MGSQHTLGQDWSPIFLSPTPFSYLVPALALSEVRVQPSTGHWGSLRTVSRDNVPSKGIGSSVSLALWGLAGR